MEKNLKAKMKSPHEEVTDFYERKIPKADSNYTCLAILSYEFDLKEKM